MKKILLLFLGIQLYTPLLGDDMPPQQPIVETIHIFSEVFQATQKFVRKVQGERDVDNDAPVIENTALGILSFFSHFQDEYTLCRFPHSSHAGELPRAVCGIIRQLKNARTDSRNYQNAFLFYGPPGTGKSTLVRALARETDSHLIELIGPALGNSYRGRGVEKVNEAFKQVEEIWARDPQKTIVVFVDAIDACTSLPLNGYIDKYENDHRMVIIVTLNDRNVLNSALLSRLEQVEFPLPDRATCAEIFFHHLKEHAQDLGDKVYEYAEKAHAAGLSGRNIENIVGKTIREKHRRKSEKIEDQLILSLIQAEDKANKAEAAAREKEEKNDVGRQEKLKRF